MSNLSFIDTSHWNLLLICSGHLQVHFRPLSIQNYSSVFHVSGSPLDKGKTYLLPRSCFTVLSVDRLSVPLGCFFALVNKDEASHFGVKYNNQ